jgi:hypothetical protein
MAVSSVIPIGNQMQFGEKKRNCSVSLGAKLSRRQTSIAAIRCLLGSMLSPHNESAPAADD